MGALGWRVFAGRSRAVAREARWCKVLSLQYHAGFFCAPSSGGWGVAGPKMFLAPILGSYQG